MCLLPKKILEGDPRCNFVTLETDMYDYVNTNQHCPSGIEISF